LGKDFQRLLEDAKNEHKGKEHVEFERLMGNVEFWAMLQRCIAARFRARDEAIKRVVSSLGDKQAQAQKLFIELAGLGKSS